MCFSLSIPSNGQSPWVFCCVRLFLFYYIFFSLFFFLICEFCFPSGRVLWACGDSAVLSERRHHLPEAGRCLQQADSQQHTTHNGPQAEDRLSQMPGGVCGQRGWAALCQITTGIWLCLHWRFEQIPLLHQKALGRRDEPNYISYLNVYPVFYICNSNGLSRHYLPHDDDAAVRMNNENRILQQSTCHSFGLLRTSGDSDLST